MAEYKKAKGEAVDYSGTLPPSWKRVVEVWLDEDVPNFDAGGYVVGDKESTAFLLGKSDGVLAGAPFFEAIFNHLGCKVEWLAEEGQKFEHITHLATVSGPARMILLGERTALNAITRVSSIATRTRKAIEISRSVEDFRGTIAATRKTTPGFRLMEKYGVLVGGGDMHRFCLSSMVMLKDNHCKSTGSITKAVETARSVCGMYQKIEVECSTVEEAEEALNVGADVVMLDNFTPEQLAADAAYLKMRFPNCLIEGSGGITIDSLRSFCVPGVDVLSMGSLIQGVPYVDISLKLQ